MITLTLSGQQAYLVLDQAYANLTPEGVQSAQDQVSALYGDAPDDRSRREIGDVATILARLADGLAGSNISDQMAAPHGDGP